MKLKNLEKQEQTKPKFSRLEETTTNYGKRSEVDIIGKHKKRTNLRPGSLKR